LTETWMEKKGWGGNKREPKGYVYGTQWAIRESKKRELKGD